jgi:hypothetical protein
MPCLLVKLWNMIDRITLYGRECEVIIIILKSQTPPTYEERIKNSLIHRHISFKTKVSHKILKTMLSFSRVGDLDSNWFHGHGYYFSPDCPRKTMALVKIREAIVKKLKK